MSAMLDVELGPLNQRQLDHNPRPLNSHMHSLSGTVFGHHFWTSGIPLPSFFICLNSVFQHSVTHFISFMSLFQEFLNCPGAITHHFRHLAFICTGLFY